MVTETSTTDELYSQLLNGNSTREYYSSSNIEMESNEVHPISEALGNRIREALQGESISFAECFGEPL